MTPDTAPSYAGFRFPQEIIAHAVWLYFRFNLSYRDVEELLAERGIVVPYETVRQWCRKFGQQFANQFRRRRARYCCSRVGRYNDYPRNDERGWL